MSFEDDVQPYVLHFVVVLLLSLSAIIEREWELQLSCAGKICCATIFRTYVDSGTKPNGVNKSISMLE